MSKKSISEDQLQGLIRLEIAQGGGWIGFDRFMALALYAPGLGYYSNDRRKFGLMPEGGSDFVTAPELSPLFGRTLAVQLRQALEATQTDAVWEFGAGTGALAAQLLEALGPAVRHYHIVDLSGSLRARQAERLSAWGDKVRWHVELPAQMQGVVVGNEVLDAMPVQLLHWDGVQWLERGVTWREGGFAWADRETDARPPLAHEPGHFPPGTVTEIHAQAEAFVRTLAAKLTRGAAFFIDYGFPEAEYYHPQRHGGTVMCHHAHRADADPLSQVGEKDITAHVNFTGIALAGQDAGLQVLGYTSQASFLVNCGLVDALAGADLAGRAMAHRLIAEHEMGELFKVLGFAKGEIFSALGFASFDRTHRL